MKVKMTVVFGLKCILGLICLTSFTVCPKTARPDFSGKWKLNVDKSEFGNTPSYAAVKSFDIKLLEDSIYINRVITNANNQETTASESISLDGKPCKLSIAGNRTKVSTITWSPNEDTMTTISSYSFPDKPQEIEYTLSQTWALSSDKKELIVSLTSPSYTIKAIYDKQ